MVQTNERAFEASKRWVEANGYSKAELDFHPVDFLVYAELQRGQVLSAEARIGELQHLADDLGDEATWLSDYIAAKRALLLVESETWKRGSLSDPRIDDHNRLLTGALNALVVDDIETANALREALRERVDAFQKQHNDSHDAMRWHIAFLQVDGSALLRRGHTDQGLQRLRRAVALLDRAGIAWETPDPIKPPAELLGEMLLFAGRPQEAVKAFEAALERRPARVLSLRGLARANVELGYNKTAEDYYRRLADRLRDADHDDAVLAEAKRFLDRPK